MFKVGVLQFSQKNKIVLSLQKQKTRKEILNAIHAINFTRQSVFISDALKTGIIHLEENKRLNAIQVRI